MGDYVTAIHINTVLLFANICDATLILVSETLINQLQSVSQTQHAPDCDYSCNLQLAAERCGKSFSVAGGNKEQELKLMLNWAQEGFLPKGPVGFLPPGMSDVIG